MWRLILFVVVLSLVIACGGGGEERLVLPEDLLFDDALMERPAAAAANAPHRSRNPDRVRYFGDPHVHTTLSFDTGQRSFYSLRAIEIPTGRWSTWDAIRAAFRVRCDLPAKL